MKIKKVLTLPIYFLFFIFLLSNFVNAYLPDIKDFSNAFNVHTTGSAPVYQRDIFLKLTKDGTIYEDTYYLERDNVDALIGVNLPKDKEFIELKVIDLSKREQMNYIPTKNIRNVEQCEGYYQIEKINNTYLLLICPFKNELEKIIKVETFLYNDEPCNCSVDKGLYFFTLKEFEVLPHQKDFRLKLSAMVDKDLYYNKSAQNITCGENSQVYYLGNGFVCDAVLNLQPNYTRQIDFTLGGEDKEMIQQREFQRQLDEQWAMTNKQLKAVWVGIFLSILIALFPLEFRNLGKRIINLLNGEVVSLNEMSAEKELLRLEYENHRTYAFAEFAALLVIAFGVISNIKGMNGYIILIFSITFIAILIGFWASFMAMRRTFEKLKGILVEEEQKSKKETKTK